MDFGAHLPHLGRRVDRRELMQFASTCEQLDMHSLWVSDHLCWPAEFKSRYPYTEDGSFGPSPDMAWLEAIGTLTFLAGTTERIALGTSVLILPYRPPVLCAKQLATLDVLSGGRLILGAGVGWMAEEAAVLGMPWDARGRRSNEYLELLRLLFTDPQPSYEGEFYTVPEVGFEPKPLQDPLPIWIGGNSPAAYRRAARFGQAFHAAFEPLEDVARGWAQVRAACEAAGRDPAELTLSLRMFLDPAGVMDPAKSIAGSGGAMCEMVEAARSIGVSHIMLDPVARGGAAGRLDAIGQFMSEVAPRCS
ncbi:MAG: LLM class F420-dependent oxidoreductase [Pseudomonadota bacterium]